MTIEQRINRLERQNRRLKLGGMFLLLGIGAVFLMGQANGEPGNLIVRSLKVVDDGGQVRLLLQGTGNQLTTWDQNGGPRIRLWGHDGAGTRLELNDGFGRTKIMLSVMDTDGLSAARAVLSDSKGIARAGISVWKKGSSVWINDENERKRAVLGDPLIGKWEWEWEREADEESEAAPVLTIERSRDGTLLASIEYGESKTNSWQKVRTAIVIGDEVTSLTQLLRLRFLPDGGSLTYNLKMVDSETLEGELQIAGAGLSTPMTVPVRFERVR